VTRSEQSRRGDERGRRGAFQRFSSTSRRCDRCTCLCVRGCDARRVLLVTWGAARRWPPTPVWRQRHGRAARSITSRCVSKAGNPHGAHRAICPRPGSQRITSALSELRTEIGVYDPATLRLFSGRPGRRRALRLGRRVATVFSCHLEIPRLDAMLLRNPRRGTRNGDAKNSYCMARKLFGNYALDVLAQSPVETT
jgi:hypothetical protein